MGKFARLAAGFGVAFAAASVAQTAAVPQPAASAPSTPDAKPADAQTRAAMERAQRMADNPMRAILEAAKIRRRPGEGEADAAAARDDAATRNAVAPAAPAPTPVLSASQLAPAATLAVAPLKAAAPFAGLTPVAQPLPEIAALPPAAPPKLLSMVEPAVPSRVLEQNPRVGEVSADLSLRADGSVAEVVLLTQVPRAWRRYLIEALQQWRYEPMAAARTHRVQLVFDKQP